MTILYDAGQVEIYCGMNLVATHDPVSYTHLDVYKRQSCLSVVVFQSNLQFVE